MLNPADREQLTEHIAKSQIPMIRAKKCVGNGELGSYAMKPAKGLF